jgi:hypothetical protein
MPDLRPPLDPIFMAFGAAATVKVPGGVPVAATAIIGFSSIEFPPPDRRDLAITERLTLTRIALRRSEVPSLPRASTVVIGAKTWTVDAIDDRDDEIVVAMVR